MKLTKYQHACFVVEKEGTTAVIDLGTYSHDFIAPHHIDVFVITHEHPDHFDEIRLRTLLAAHPQATVIAHESISGRFTDYTTIAARVGELYTVGALRFRFFGGAHAPISPAIATPPNLSVLIDERLYYPGDSFTLPETTAIQELALPVSAPWLKISETIDFFMRSKPIFAFPTHDAILSREGKELVDRLLGTVAAGQQTTYKRLDSSSIEL